MKKNCQTLYLSTLNLYSRPLFIPLTGKWYEKFLEAGEHQEYPELQECLYTQVLMEDEVTAGPTLNKTYVNMMPVPLVDFAKIESGDPIISINSHQLPTASETDAGMQGMQYFSNLFELISFKSITK